MGLDADIYSTLLGYAPLTELVNLSIYPEHGWQDNEAPAVVFYRVPGGERVHDIQGYAGKTFGAFEISAYSTSIDERREISDAVIDGMTLAVRFRCKMFAPPYDDYDPDTKIYERIMQFDVSPPSVAFTPSEWTNIILEGTDGDGVDYEIIGRWKTN